MSKQLTPIELQQLQIYVKKKIAKYQGVDELQQVKKEVLERMEEHLHISTRTPEVYQQGVGRLFHYLSQLKTYSSKWTMATRGIISKVKEVVVRLEEDLGGRVVRLGDKEAIFRTWAQSDKGQRCSDLMALVDDSCPDLVELAFREYGALRVMNDMIMNNDPKLADLMAIISTFRPSVQIEILFPPNEHASPLNTAIAHNQSGVMPLIDYMTPLLPMVEGYPHHSADELKVAAADGVREISDARLLAFYVRYQGLGQSATGSSPKVSESLAEVHSEMWDLVSDIISARSSDQFDQKILDKLIEVLNEYEQTGARVESTKQLYWRLRDLTDLPEGYRFLAKLKAEDEAHRVASTTAVAAEDEARRVASTTAVAVEDEEKGFVELAAIGRKHAKRALSDLMDSELDVSEKVRLILLASTIVDGGELKPLYEADLFHDLSNDDLIELMIYTMIQKRTLGEGPVRLQHINLSRSLQAAAHKKEQRGSSLHAAYIYELQRLYDCVCEELRPRFWKEENPFDPLLKLLQSYVVELLRNSATAGAYVSCKQLARVLHCAAEMIEDEGVFLSASRRLLGLKWDKSFEQAEKDAIDLGSSYRRLIAALVAKSDSVKRDYPRLQETVKKFASDCPVTTALYTALSVRNELAKLAKEYGPLPEATHRIENQQQMVSHVKKEVAHRYEDVMRQLVCVDSESGEIVVSKFWQEDLMSFLHVVTADNRFGKLVKKGLVSRLGGQLQKLKLALQKSLQVTESEFVPRKEFLQQQFQLIGVGPLKLYDVYLCALIAGQYPDMMRGYAEPASNQYKVWVHVVTSHAACYDVDTLTAFKDYMTVDFYLKQLSRQSSDNMLTRSAALSTQSYSFILDRMVSEIGSDDWDDCMEAVIDSVASNHDQIGVFHEFLHKLPNQVRVWFLMHRQADDLMLLQKPLIYVDAPFSYFIDCLQALSSSEGVSGQIDKIKRAWKAKYTFYEELYFFELANAPLVEGDNIADLRPKESIEEAFSITEKIALLGQYATTGVTGAMVEVADKLKEILQQLLNDQYTRTYDQYPALRRSIDNYEIRADARNKNRAQFFVESVFLAERLNNNSELFKWCCSEYKLFTVSGREGKEVYAHICRKINALSSGDKRIVLLGRVASNEGYQLLRNPCFQQSFSLMANALDTDLFWDVIHTAFAFNQGSDMQWLKESIEGCDSDKAGLENLKSGFMLHHCYHSMCKIRSKYQAIIEEKKGSLTSLQQLKSLFVDRLLDLFVSFDDVRITVSEAADIIRNLAIYLPILERTEEGVEAEKGLYSDVKKLLCNLAGFGVYGSEVLSAGETKERLINLISNKLNFLERDFNLGVLRLLVDREMNDVAFMFLGQQAGLFALHHAISTQQKDCLRLINYVGGACPEFFCHMEESRQRHALHVAASRSPNLIKPIAAYLSPEQLKEAMLASIVIKGRDTSVTATEHPEIDTGLTPLACALTQSGSVEEILRPLYRLEPADQIELLMRPIEDGLKAFRPIESCAVCESYDPVSLRQLIAYAVGDEGREPVREFLTGLEKGVAAGTVIWIEVEEFRAVATAAVGLKLCRARAVEEKNNDLVSQVDNLQRVIAPVLKAYEQPMKPLDHLQRELESLFCDDPDSFIDKTLRYLRRNLMVDGKKGSGKSEERRPSLSELSIMMVPVKADRVATESSLGSGNQ